MSSSIATIYLDGRIARRRVDHVARYHDVVHNARMVRQGHHGLCSRRDIPHLRPTDRPIEYACRYRVSWERGSDESGRTLMVLSYEPLTTELPSRCTQATLPLWDRSLRRCSPDCVSHTRSEWS